AQFQGDAMLITFNTIAPDPQHAANALHTAIEIRDITMQRTFGEGIVMRTRCGVNTGSMVTGAVGAGDRLLYTVHGDEVNIAARLEQLNKTHGTYILVAGNTVEAVGEAFRFREMGEITVRGRTQPTRVYTLAEQ
ncbi:MAG: adenylate/guanylate cyclase domain-containing protein, partial [Proteobacteria bacterium]|nr:adenylate/guanylate cyclase domain-containing protein [Pseudomonadota bacterium]